MEWVPLISWLAIAAVLTILGGPLAAAIFDRLPGRGAHFGLHVSLVIIGLASFWVGHLRYGWVALIAAVSVLAALSAIAYRRGYTPEWPAVAEGYAVFLVGFSLTLVVRITDNTIRAAGGEQFLHFGLLNAVGRADRLPPEDMWWAGEPVNYYYGGHVLVDQLSRLAFTEPRLAYNLGFAVFFGLAAAAAFGLVGAVVDAYGYRRRVGGSLAVVLLLLAGTLTTPARLIIARLPESIATRYGAFAFEAIPTLDPIDEVIAGYADIAEWSWWFERRVVGGTLVETPLFSMVKADLHGHVTTIPFMIATVAVAFAYYQTPADRRRRRLALVFLVLPAMAGLVGWMNTWSLPGAVGIAWLALALSPAHPRSMLAIRRDVDGSEAGATTWLRAEASRLVGATVGALAVGAIGAAVIAPFLLFQLPTNDGIGVLPDRSPLGPHLLLYGAFFIIFAVFLTVALSQRRSSTMAPVQVYGIATAAIIATGLIAAAGFASLAIPAVMLLLTWWLARRRPSIGFIAVLIAGTLGLILAMELIHAEVWPPEEERLNTTYKLSMQAMVFGLLTTAAIITAVVSERLPKRGSPPSLASVGVVAVVALVVLLLLTFPVLTLGGEFAQFAGAHPHVHYSIDALDGHDRWNADDMEAIEWLETVEGDPVLLEAPGERIYTFVNPASTFTGLPSVLGWAHERGYRGVDAYYDRQDDVDAIYTHGDTGLLGTYEVDLIWVGDSERERYGDQLIDPGQLEGVSVAFSNDEVTIYAVDHDRLSG